MEAGALIGSVRPSAIFLRIAMHYIIPTFNDSAPGFMKAPMIFQVILADPSGVIPVPTEQVP